MFLKHRRSKRIDQSLALPRCPSLSLRTPLRKKKRKAALAIKKLGYVQRIPELIRLINLPAPSSIVTEPDIAQYWPCVGALANFGVAAIPSLVEAYYSEVNQDRRRLIYRAILHGQNSREAYTYAMGLLAKKKTKRQNNAWTN